MDISSPEGMTYTNIRQTIRELILPLVQAIYDENPSDMILFCSEYFNDLHKRENDEKNRSQIKNCVEEINQEKEDDVECQIESEEDNFPTYIQGSASAPTLTKDKPPRGVNLRGSSSWGTPANFTEPIKSLAVLEDAASGIGDQPSLVKSQIENEAQSCGSMKHDSAFGDDTFREHKTVDDDKNDSCNEEYSKSTHLHDGNTDEVLTTLCNEFQLMKASEVTESLKHDDMRYNDSAQEIETTDINVRSKQLSPNSSFGFIPQIKECDIEEEIKNMDYEDLYGEKFKIQINDINGVISESFHNAEAEISNVKTDFNSDIGNEKEISGVIHEQNEASSNKPERVLNQRNDAEEKKCEMITNNFDESDLESIRNENDKKIVSAVETANRNASGHIDPEINIKEHKETKEDLTKPIDSHLEKFSDKEKPKTASFNNDDDKSDQSESQTTVDKLWRKRWYEAHPSFGSFSRFQSRDTRFHRARFPDIRPNIGEAGDVPLDRFYIPNGASNTSCRPRNQNTTESSPGIKEYSYPRFLSDEINHRSNSARPFDNLVEKKTSTEKLSNANPQNIPYSWRKLCKQSRSSENVNYTIESQTNSNEETQDSVISVNKDQTPSLNEAEKTSETDVIETEDIFYEASEKTTDKPNMQIKGSKEGKSKQYQENVENIPGKLANDEVHDAEQDTIMNVSIDCKYKSQSNEYLRNQDGIIHGQNAPEKSILAQNCKQSTTEDGKVRKTKDFIHNGVLLRAQKDKAINQHNDDSLKEKFDLDAACGDFVTSVKDAAEQDIDSPNAVMELEENNEAEQNNVINEPISMEYFEEVIERVIEQQNSDLKDSYEGINFSSYSGSDSSYIELSDCSESDDLSTNDNFQDK